MRQSLNLGEVERRCVAGSRHHESSVGETELQRLGKGSAIEESVDDTRRETVATADPVEDGEMFESAGLDHAVLTRPRDGAPVVLGGRVCPAPRSGDELAVVHGLRGTDAAHLSQDELLLPPMMTNRLPWSRGYFETIANWPLEPGDVLDQHCFWNVARRTYFDEANNELPDPIEPVGRRALHSFRTIDDAVSKARHPARARLTTVLAEASEAPG